MTSAIADLVGWVEERNPTITNLLNLTSSMDSLKQAIAAFVECVT
ncbi:hypothetical protein [Crocosphaera sp. XPORK-15E]|nr:hypothetical protein [Crocosphaera sp. XPORK-15E]MEA5534131.1 hypothetical protein [Crocosphaera sp. XPORK-15E]